eukprot:SAG22_NODE_19407_length_275_cov_0.590909_1_plen_73_part_10
MCQFAGTGSFPRDGGVAGMKKRVDIAASGELTSSNSQVPFKLMQRCWLATPVPAESIAASTSVKYCIGTWAGK